MTPIADMVEQMLSTGVPADAIVLAVRTAERHAVTSRVTLNETPGAVRTRRWREKRQQNQGGAEANDAAPQIPEGRHTKRHGVTHRCDLLTLSEASKEGSKERVVTRARGTRITADWQPDEADKQFARGWSVDPEKLRPEFVDFWIAVPGQRGCKLSWSATWRNRVRTVGKPPATEAKKVEQSGFYASFDSPQLAAWEAHERNGGTKYPRDRKGGWRFPTEWPPGHAT